MKANMRAGLAVLLLLLLAGSSAAQTMPAACKATFKTNGAALMAAMGGLKKACPPGAKTCSAACKAAFKKVGAGGFREASGHSAPRRRSTLPLICCTHLACQPPLTHTLACSSRPPMAAGPPQLLEGRYGAPGSRHRQLSRRRLEGLQTLSSALSANSELSASESTAAAQPPAAAILHRPADP